MILAISKMNLESQLSPGCDKYVEIEIDCYRII